MKYEKNWHEKRSGVQKQVYEKELRSLSFEHACQPAPHLPGKTPPCPRQLQVFHHHLREGVVPQNGGFGIVVLVAVDDDHQGQRQGLKWVRKGDSSYWGKGLPQRAGSEGAGELLDSYNMVKNSWYVIECFLKLN